MGFCMTENKYGLDLEITSLWYIPFWKSPTFYAIIISSLILLLIVLIYFFYKKRNLKNQDPVVLLIKSLNHNYNDLDKIDAQSFYFNLIYDYKKFINYKYKFAVFDKTDREFKYFLSSHQELDRKLIDLLTIILDDSYLVRFTKSSINKSKMESDLQQTIKVMQQIISSENR